MNWLENIWLKILELRGEILAGIFAASVFILLFAINDYPYARELSKEALGWIFVIAVLSFFLVLARLGKAAFDAIKSRMKERTTHLKRLGSDAKWMHGQLKYREGFQTAQEGIELYRARIESLFISLREAGFATLRVRDEDSSVDTLAKWTAYLDTVGQFLSAGQVKEAKKFASDLIAEFNSR